MLVDGFIFSEFGGRMGDPSSFICVLQKNLKQVKSKINLYFSDLNILVIRMILETSHLKKFGGEMLGV